MADRSGSGRPGLGAPASHRDPGTLRIGTIGGIDVLVRSSWLLVAALIAYLVAPAVDRVQPGLGNGKYVAGLAFAVLLTLSLLLHEVSHALMAKRYGIPVRSITLHFIGGVTAIDGEPRTPKQEFTISAVGPATSLAVAGAAYLLLQISPAGLLEFALAGLAGANLIIGLLNLVPGMPLDGGRVLRAAVWQFTGDQHRGTLASGWAGRVVAILMLFSPTFLRAAGIQTTILDYVIAAVLGWFLWTAASAAIVSAKVRARLPRLVARELARRAVTVADDLPLAQAIEVARQAQAGAVVTLSRDGGYAGVVNEAAVQATPQDRWPWLPVSAVTRTLGPGLALPIDIAGEDLVLAMRGAPATEYLLVEPDGRLYGVLVTQDVDAAFSAR